MEYVSNFYPLFIYSPTLTWRDVQYLIVRTSRRENLRAKDWTLNGAGYEGMAKNYL